MALLEDNSRFRRKAQHQRNLPDLNEVQWDMSDVPFVRNKDYQY